MKVKSYYARSVEEAVDQASNELGADAMLVHSRKAPLETRHLGPYEVIFALPSGKQKELDRIPGLPMPAAALESEDSGAPRPSDPVLSLEIMQLRRQMEEIRRSLTVRTSPAAQGEDSPAARAERILLGFGLDEELASSIAVTVAGAAPAKRRKSRARANANTEDADAALFQNLRAELGSRLAENPGIRQRGDDAGVIAFIGPPGAGKTTSLIKLAAQLSHTSERPVYIICTDSFRIGAADQMRIYASIMGLGVEFTDRPSLLSQAIAANRHKEMILVDTPGLSGSDFSLLDELAAFLGRRADIEKHLVLPATMRPRDLRRCLRNYERFQPDKLLFTHLDETDLFGSLYSAAATSALPVSFLSAGQQIPEDLSEASNERLLDLLVGADRTLAHA